MAFLLGEWERTWGLLLLLGRVKQVSARARVRRCCCPDSDAGVVFPSELLLWPLTVRMGHEFGRIHRPRRGGAATPLRCSVGRCGTGLAPAYSVATSQGFWPVRASAWSCSQPPPSVHANNVRLFLGRMLRQHADMAIGDGAVARGLDLAAPDAPLAVVYGRHPSGFRLVAAATTPGACPFSRERSICTTGTSTATW